MTEKYEYVGTMYVYVFMYVRYTHIFNMYMYI